MPTMRPTVAMSVHAVERTVQNLIHSACTVCPNVWRRTELDGTNGVRVAVVVIVMLLR